jgi:hypothetical protein
MLGDMVTGFDILFNKGNKIIWGEKVRKKWFPLLPAVGLLPAHFASTQDTTAAYFFLVNSNKG